MSKDTRKCLNPVCENYDVIVKNEVCEKCGMQTTPMKQPITQKLVMILIPAVVIVLVVVLGIAGFNIYKTNQANNSVVPVIGKNEIIVSQSILDFIGKETQSHVDRIKESMSDYQKGFKLYKDKKYDEAVKYFDKIISIDTREALASILDENCKVMNSTDDYIKIGVAGPMTGDSSQNGVNELLGTALAQKQINSLGGITGKKLVVQIADDSGNDQDAANVAKELSDNSKILGIVGHIGSSNTLSAARIYEKVGVVAISPSSSAPEITNAGKYIFRVCPDNNAQADFLTKYALRKGIKSPVILFNTNDIYSKQFKVRVNEALKQKGINTLSVFEFEKNKENFSDIVNKIKKLNADSVFFIGKDTEGTYFVNSMRNADKNIKIFAGDSVYTYDFLEGTKKNSDGVAVAAFYHANANFPFQKDFTDAFRKYFHGDPNARCALAYDCVFAIKKALEKSGDFTREGLLKGLDGMSFEGSTGRITFDKNGDAVDKNMVILEVKDGGFKPIVK